MLRGLPVAVVSLIFATLALSESTSPNDPFRALVLRIPRQPDPPICCLKPTQHDNADDQILLSFEEWKAKQSQILEESIAPGAAERPSERSGHDSDGVGSRTRA